MIDVEFLSQFGIFSNVEADKLADIARLLRERRYEKGEIIFHQGEPGDTVFFLREGRVKVYRVEEDGKDQILRIFGAGEAFGLVVALDRQPYPSTAEAVIPARVWSMRVVDFQKVQQLIPDLIPRTLSDVAHRLRLAQDRAHALAVRDVHTRLVAFLLDEAQRNGRPEGDRVVLTLPITREELAGLLGTVRETVSRALGDLRRTGAIQEKGGDLLLDLGRLDQWSKR